MNPAPPTRGCFRSRTPIAPAIACALVLGTGCAASSRQIHPSHPEAGHPGAHPKSSEPAAPAWTPPPGAIADIRVALYRGHYRWADSSATALITSVSGATAVDSVRFADLFDLGSEAAWRNGDFRSTRSADWARRSLAIRETMRETDDLAVAKSLVALGQALMVTHQSFAAADSVLRRALAIRKAHLGADDTLTASVVFELGRVAQDLGRDAESQYLHERALAIREKAFGSNHADVAASLVELADVLCSRGDFARARTMIDRSLSIIARQLGTDHPLYGTSMATKSKICRATGDFDEAIRTAHQAIEVRISALGPDHQNVGSAIMGLVDSYVWCGRYREGQEQALRALPIYEKALGPDDVRLARPIGALGDLYHAFGDEAKAGQMLERALALRERNLQPLHPAVALSLDRLGEFYTEIGEYERARVVLERALSIRRQVLPPGHVDLATSLDRLARSEAALGHGPVARKLLEEAIPIFEHTQGPINSAGWGYEIQAQLAYADGEYERAAQCFERARDLLRNNGPAGSAGAEYGLGAAELALNRLEAARASFTSSSREYAEALGPDHYATAFPLPGLSLTELRLGHPRTAFEVARRAETIERSEARSNIRVLPEQEGLRVAATRRDALDMMLAVVSRDMVRDPYADRVALDALVRSRAIVFDEIGARHHPAGERGDTAIARLAERYASASRRLANIEVHGTDGKDPALFHRLVDDAARDRDDAETVLAQRSAAFQDERSRRARGIDEVQTALREHEALVSFARFEREWVSRTMFVRPGRGTQHVRPAPPAAYVAFVLRHGDRAPVVVPLGSALKVDERVCAWQRAVSPSGGGNTNEAAYRATARALERAVWEPVARYLRGVTHVFVVPDGALQLVNWGAMPVGRDRYLVETEPLISYLSAERDLVESPASMHGSGLLAIGAPDFDADLIGGNAPTEVAGTVGGDRYRGARSRCDEFRSARFDTLPAARRELDNVTAAWRRAGDEGAPPSAGVESPALGATTELTGRLATESAFVEDAPGRRVIHVATHAFFTGAECPTGATLRGVGGMVPAVAGIPAPPPDNPLVLSGLVFAGANHRDRAAPGQDDGILTAEEIAALDLTGVEWAVLSGCETGVGHLTPGEGVLGLRRAFEVAGARTLIISLWPVEDRATGEWMSHLYRARLERGMPTSAAVREACLAVLRDRRAHHQSTHPGSWAAFVSLGDWR